MITTILKVTATGATGIHTFPLYIAHHEDMERVLEHLHKDLAAYTVTTEPLAATPAEVKAHFPK